MRKPTSSAQSQNCAAGSTALEGARQEIGREQVYTEQQREEGDERRSKEEVVIDWTRIALGVRLKLNAFRWSDVRNLFLVDDARHFDTCLIDIDRLPTESVPDVASFPEDNLEGALISQITFEVNGYTHRNLQRADR